MTTNNELDNRLSAAPVVPLIQADDVDIAVRTAAALAAGGLTVIEVVMRTDEALQCLRAISERLDNVIAGAGTVLSVDQANAAIASGARFIVSPGLDEGVVTAAQQSSLPVFPGVATASELQRAWNLGLRAVKLFPASIVGGVGMVRALASVFRDVRFMPTGGVSTSNLGEYLGEASVLACGGSWLTPKAAIANGDFASITALASDALDIARAARG